MHCYLPSGKKNKSFALLDQNLIKQTYIEFLKIEIELQRALSFVHFRDWNSEFVSSFNAYVLSAHKIAALSKKSEVFCNKSLAQFAEIAESTLLLDFSFFLLQTKSNTLAIQVCWQCITLLSTGLNKKGAGLASSSSVNVYTRLR